jgi:pyruvate dehydrogenase phosphatase
VKKLYTQGGTDEKFNECINLMRVQHQNIVRLIGYCYKIEKRVGEYNGKLVFADDEERLLCFEYLQGGSLDGYLSGMMDILDKIIISLECKQI